MHPKGCNGHVRKNAIFGTHKRNSLYHALQQVLVRAFRPVVPRVTNEGGIVFLTPVALWDGNATSGQV